MFIYLYIYIYIHIYTHTHARTHAHNQTSTHTHTHEQSNKHARIHTHTHALNPSRCRTHTHKHSPTPEPENPHTHTHTHAVNPRRCQCCRVNRFADLVLVLVSFCIYLHISEFQGDSPLCAGVLGSVSSERSFRRPRSGAAPIGIVGFFLYLSIYIYLITRVTPSQVSMLSVQLTNVMGDVLVCAGTISYLGPFTAGFRASIVAEWLTEMKAHKLPFTPDCTLSKILADPVQVRQWNIDGLPADAFSIENGIM